ncbi:MAG: alpha/beta hydrolase [Acidobacteriaceae bacterium]|nr:alpha/beta hydrolase [Acidobacteriaceae bacterium]
MRSALRSTKAQLSRSFSRQHTSGRFRGGVHASADGPVPQIGYLPLHGLNMFYETMGTEQLIVLLRGSLSTIDTDFRALLPTLALTRKLIRVEQQAHGHTADIDRPLRVEQMAEDTAELLLQLKVEKADPLGYSLGVQSRCKSPNDTPVSCGSSCL